MRQVTKILFSGLLPFCLAMMFSGCEVSSLSGGGSGTGNELFTLLTIALCELIDLFLSDESKIEYPITTRKFQTNRKPHYQLISVTP